MTGTCMLLAAALAIVPTATTQDSSFPITMADGVPRVPGARHIEVTLRFDRPVPPLLEIVRLGRTDGKLWRLAEVSRRPVSALTREVTTSGPAGLDTLLLIRAAGQKGYILDGPFRWPLTPATYLISARWRRTVRGEWTRGGGGSPTWLSALEAPARDAWPQCSWSSESAWECIGVPLDEPGVVLSTGRAQVTYAIARGDVGSVGVENASAHAAPWARLLIVLDRGTGDRADGRSVSVSALRTGRPSGRPQSVRTLAIPEADVRVETVSGRAFWVTGAARAEASWIELTEPGYAPARLSLTDVAGSPPELPMLIPLDPGRSLFGRVHQDDGRPLDGATLMLYRFMQTRTREGGDSPPLRMLVSEQATKDDGEFRFDGLQLDRYELVAMHPVHGMGQWRLEPHGQAEDLRLEHRRRAVGRVVRDGTAASGVRVAVMPDIGEFATAADELQLAGGEALTDEDGRFSVALPATGKAELRVGDETTGIRRIAVGSAGTTATIVDVGVIELGARRAVSLIVEASDGCDVLLTGPAGSAGLTMMRARRAGASVFDVDLPEPGRWLVAASCGGRERLVSPSFIDVPARGRDILSFRLTLIP